MTYWKRKAEKSHDCQTFKSSSSPASSSRSLSHTSSPFIATNSCNVVGRDCPPPPPPATTFGAGAGAGPGVGVGVGAGGGCTDFTDDLLEGCGGSTGPASWMLAARSRIKNGFCLSLEPCVTDDRDEARSGVGSAVLGGADADAPVSSARFCSSSNLSRSAFSQAACARSRASCIGSRAALIWGAGLRLSAEAF